MTFTTSCVIDEAITTRSLQTSWMLYAACRGHSAVFFDVSRERPEARTRREAHARLICESCAVLEDCRAWARARREYGLWGGETEEERAAAGYRVDMPVGRLTRYPRGEGVPVTPRPPRGEVARSRAS